MSSTPAAAPLPKPAASVELRLDGMTCSACASRIERRLNRLEGVAATVNFATETAAVRYDPLAAGPDELVAAVRAAGYGAAVEAPRLGAPSSAGGASADPAARASRELRFRALVSAALALPVAALAMVPAFQFPRWPWVSLILATPVVFWGGWPFHRVALRNLRHGAATMDTLISLGSLAAYGWSLYVLFGGALSMPATMPGMAVGAPGMPDLYLDAASGIVVFLLIGRFLEQRAKRRAGSALRELLELGAREVTVLRDGGEVHVPIEQLHPGDRFVVRPGEKVATDGVVVEGRSAIDESLLTGEALPVDVAPGSTVTGATVNAGGRLLVRATRVGKETRLAQMGRLVVAAQAGKAPVQRAADQISLFFVPFVLFLAVSTLGVTLLVGGTLLLAFTAAVAVVIVACPCALGLATPVALLVGTGRGAQLGLVVRRPEVLESARRVDTVVLDKTGTVTTGRMEVSEVRVAPGVTEAELLRRAGALEAASEHPLAAAIVAAAGSAVRPPVTEVRALAGLGIAGIVEGEDVVAGRPDYLAGRGMPLDPELAAAHQELEARGMTVVVVGWGCRTCGLIGLRDTVRPESAAAVADLKRLGLRPVLLTGDTRQSALAAARQVGIDERAVIAEVLPEDKLQVVRGLQQRGRVVAMVGDGVNDAAALAQADLGLAMGSGAGVAVEAGDITLVRGELTAVVDAIRLSRRTLRTIHLNLLWAFVYNAVLIPVAALRLVSPLLAGLAMACSSLFVVLNSLRLRGFTPRRHPHPSKKGTFV